MSGVSLKLGGHFFLAPFGDEVYTLLPCTMVAEYHTIIPPRGRFSILDISTVRIKVSVPEKKSALGMSRRERELSEDVSFGIWGHPLGRRAIELGKPRPGGDDIHRPPYTALCSRGGTRFWWPRPRNYSTVERLSSGG